MSNSDLVAQINSLISEIESKLALIIDVVSPEPGYPAWLPLLGSFAPDYHADFVNGKYWAAHKSQVDFASFKEISGFAGSASFDDGLWCGPAKGNKLFPSNDFSTWQKANCSVTAENGWQKITENTANSSHEVYKAVTFNNGQPHTLSGKFKAGTATKCRLWLTAASIGFYVDIDLSTGTIGLPTSWGAATSLSAGIINLGNGEYLVWVSGICSPTSQAYFDIALLNGSSWQYTGTGRHIFVKECQLEQGSLTNYTATTTAAITIPTSQLTRSVAAPAVVTKRMKIKIAAQAASDYEVFYHLDNNQYDANYADTELFRYQSSLYVRTTKQNTIYRETGINVSNDQVITVAWTTSANGLVVSFNGETPIILSGDTFSPDLIKERINGNMIGIRIANGKILEDATWFLAASATELQMLAAV